MALSFDQFIVQVEIKDGIALFVSFITLCLFIWHLCKNQHSDVRMLWQIQGVAFLFMASYFFQNVIWIIQDIENFLSLAGNNVAAVIFVLTFNTLIIYRLDKSFRESVLKLHASLLILLYVLTVIDGVFYGLFQFCGTAYGLCAFYLWSHVFIDSVIGFVVTYLFIKKLWQFVMLNVSGSQSLDEHLLESATPQNKYLNIMTKQTMLSVVAVSFNDLYLILWAFELYEMDQTQQLIRYEYVLGFWWCEEVTIWVRLFCIYLSFSFANSVYYFLCGKCHEKCKRCLRNSKGRTPETAHEFDVTLQARRTE